MTETLVAIDGYSLIYRAFYAMPELTTSGGVPIGAVAGFLNMLFKALDDYDPAYIAVAFDMYGPTFRHNAFADYKATRKPTPDELRSQFPVARRILEAMGIRVVGIPGYEGDDILGTLSRMAEEKGLQTLLITGDRDTLQLISDRTHVLLTLKGLTQIQEMDEPALMEKYGLLPSQIPDLKGLMGDSSDNIPGIPGVGEKTALTLLSKFGSVESLLSHVDELKGKQREKVEANAHLARMSKELATICRDAPVQFDLESCRRVPLEKTDVLSVLREYELFSLIRRLEAEMTSGGDTAPAPMERASDYVRMTVSDPASLSDLAQYLAGVEAFSICHRDTLTLCDGKTVWDVPLMVDLTAAGMDLTDVLRGLRPAFSGSARIILHDAKSWMHLLDGYDVRMNGNGFDTMIAGYLLNAASGRYDIPRLIQDTFHILHDHPDAGDMFRLAEAQETQMRETGLWDLFCHVEMPLVRVLYDMEQIGFPVDREVLCELQKNMDARIIGLEEAIIAQAGYKFNINSTRQLGEVLFERLGLPVIKKNKTGPSTDAAVLEQLCDMHPIVSLIMEYRQLTKLKGTFIDGLLPLIRTGRLHTQLNQTGTATGRLSSSEPNLQNIPVRIPEGRMIRKAFVAEEGHVLVDADYSQIELRVLAHMANDPGLIEAFAGGRDIHAQTASQVFGIAPEDVTGDMRSAAKAVNFGIVYGISDFGLSRQLGISRQEAGEYIRKYLDTYREVGSFMQQVIETGKETGAVSTLYGRRRPMPDLRARDYNTRTAAERMAMNAPIQGTAADIIKIAMIRVAHALEEAGLKARLVLQVHDELIIDAPVGESETVAAMLQDCMEKVADLRVPLKVDVHIGKSWYEAK